MSPHRITDHGEVATAMGPARRVQIEREDGAAMGWREVWEVFAAAYPGEWGDAAAAGGEAAGPVQPVPRA